MKRLIPSLFFVALFASVAIAQLAPTPQPVPVQAQTAPCVTAPSNAQRQQGNSPGYIVPSKWKKLLDQERQKILTMTGLPVPDLASDIEHAANAKTTLPPCPPKPLPLVATPQTSAVKLPPDTSVTFHCNPLTLSPKDPSGRQTLTLPDPHDFAVPKGNEFEADGVVPDLAAKTPCYLVKVDPKTQKSFIQQ